MLGVRQDRPAMLILKVARHAHQAKHPHFWGLVALLVPLVTLALFTVPQIVRRVNLELLVQ